MNYLDFYNLAEEPFSSLKTNPRFFYNAPQYRYAKAILNDGIITKSAHLYLTGPVGSGKTTLLKVIQIDLQTDEKNLVFFTFAPRQLRSSHSFLKRLCKEMDIPSERSYVDLLESFENQVALWAQQGKTPILLIDEAHKLTPPAFDFLHHAMNFVTADKLLIVIVLAGQEELATKIKKKKELKSRMQALSLSSLSLDDAKELIQHRWTIASNGLSNPLPFTAEALEQIYRSAVGLPRDICTLCYRTLQYGLAQEQKTISADLVITAAESLKLSDDGHKES